MSGGVDSSAAALLLSRADYDVIGMTALLFGEASAAGPCCGREGGQSAAAVCAHLGLEHRQIDLSDFFEEQVITRFIGEYRAGRTPNPCSDCNRFVKFDRFFEYADEWGCEYLATGHYAKTVARASLPVIPLTDRDKSAARDGRPPEKLLAVAADSAKDQSYFLACIAPEKLARVLFPLGDLTKPQVRALAAEAGLPTAQRAESQDVCFMSHGAGVAQLLSWHAGAEPQGGPIVDEAGRVLGQHPGIEHFTVGQRKGLRLGGGTEGLVVHRVEPESKTVVVAQHDAHPIAALRLAQFTDMAPGLWSSSDELELRARYRQALWPGRVELAAAAPAQESGASAIVRPLAPQHSAAPGQWCVGYRDGVVLFGGIIERVEYER